TLPLAILLRRLSTTMRHLQIDISMSHQVMSLCLGQKTSPRIRMRNPLSVAAHFRRVAVLVVSAICRTWIPFVLMGVMNRLFPTFGSVFFCYAGNERYATHYSYPFSRKFLLWFPSIIGVFRQG